MRMVVLVMSFVAPADAATGVALQLVAGGVPNLVDIQSDGSSGRLFLVCQQGEIRIFNGSEVQATPFLDLSTSVSSGGERGLLGLAFHPDYAANGFFFVFYTNTVGNIVIARYQVSADANVANAASGTILLTVQQQFATHNGGQLRFGPDGFLYVGLGDGGDTPQNAQDLNALLGKLLRLDVDSGEPYAIPPDNPFVGTPGARGEIWALGLRNPWRFSFDRQTGDLFIADVGQLLWEEVDMQPAAGGGGRNYGWRLMEGRHCYQPSSGCNDGTLILPVVEYAHALGCSITGGFRYRGTALTGYTGTYFFGDLCNGIISGATVDTQGAWHVTQLLDTAHTITTFGEDAAGELYVANYGSSGQVYRLVAAPTPPMRLTVTKIPADAGRVSSFPALLDCGDVCAADLQPGTFVSLGASAEGGAAFAGWSGHPDCTDGTETSVTMTGDRACTARFGTAFTDNLLAPGATVIRAVHINELRLRINALRAGANLAAFEWSDATLAPTATIISAIHVLELRSALDQVYAARKLTAPAYTDSGLSAIVIKVEHITQLRDAVIALESR
jgi:glucose/arabinose dehydrogenase